MEYKIEKYNDEVVFINVKNGNGLEVTLCNFGASTYNLLLNKKPMILSIEDKEYFLNSPNFYGKTLGRVAGRVLCDQDIDGVKYHLDETLGGYSLHGGNEKSLSFKAWNYVIKEFKNRLDVIFTIKCKNKENGFLGALNLKVIYEVYANKNDFKIIFKGSTPNASLLNLSNHIYWNFNLSKNVSDYTLKVNSEKYGVIDTTTFIRDTDKLPWYLDFNRATKLNPRLDYLEKKTWLKTIDNTFIFTDILKNKPQCILKNEDVRLSLYTDYPAMNIFVDNFRVPIKFVGIKNIEEPRRAIALEPQLYNYDIDNLKLRKGDKYSHFILYKFKELN